MIKDFFLNKVYYPVEDFYQIYRERVLRSLAFAKIGWLNYDFDSVFLYKLMAFKLRRIKRTLEKGYSVQEKTNMDALSEAIDICDRLHNEEYELKYHLDHDLKWGDYVPWGTEVADVDKDGNPLTYKCIFKDRPNVKTDEDREQEKSDLFSIYEKAELDRHTDITRLAEILKNHAPTWWDL